MLHEIQPLNKEEIQLIEGIEFRSILMERIPSQEQAPKSAASALFFDIETTGLSADRSFVFLIGCICCEEGKWNRHQFCIRLVQEESLLLSSFFEITKKARFLVHFNGNTFDIPFIEKRAAANGLCSCFDGLLSIDLYQHFRPLRKILNLPHMNQSFLEKYIGWEREDTLSGKEVVSLFWNYASSPETAIEKTLSPAAPDINDTSTEQTAELLLLRHNRDDLLGMLQILKLEAYCMLFSGQDSMFQTISVSDSHSALQFHFTTALPLPHPLQLTRPVFKKEENSPVLTLSVNASSGNLTVPIFCETLRYYIPDYKNYYYLPLEQQAIHKSVASYVAKEYRVPAKPDTCYVEKTGLFLPLPQSFPASDDFAFLKEKLIFRESYDAKQFFFEYTEGTEQPKEFLSSYCKACLTLIFRE
ncbi:MAG: ribonuclease H-like domain-containing protein [Lachnospiraceae bacterium]|nr:ribonuclease H-like domain-containing protein [Lachnospiraceae bacterium]